MNLIEQIRTEIGEAYVLLGNDMAPWATDWTGKYTSDPIAVVRPHDTAQVAQVVRLAVAAGTAIVPVGGNTGLNGGAVAKGALLLSLDRLNRIEQLDPDGRTATVGAGVILSNLHAAAEAHGMIFPLTFGAKGSAMIGGVLSTNAGGSNVVRYGNTRDLVLGLEAVMADGRVMNLMGALHKDNSGLNLKHLLIGAEGTLGIITRAVVKLFPKPRAYATALVALPDLDTALRLLNHCQEASSGAVEAFEFMPDGHMDGYFRLHPDARDPLSGRYPVNILIELGATSPRDADPACDGSRPIDTLLLDILAEMLDRAEVLDAAVAQSDAQRSEFWAIREAAAEIAFSRTPFVDTDLAVALGDVGKFLAQITPRIKAIDADACDLAIAHLGDGNIHYTVYPSRDEPVLLAQIRQEIAALTVEMLGSFSAEHGVGLSKLSTMAAYKDPVALDTMRAIKSALDPQGILNPGKVIPD